MRAQLEAERGERLTPRSQKSFADPDAAIMPTSDGALTYAYNAQAAVSTDGLVVASGVTTAVRDTGQLLPIAAAVAANTGALPEIVIADNGYLTEDKRRDAATPGAALSRGGGPRGQGAAALAARTRDPPHAPSAPPAVGAMPVRAP